jgi:DNA-binding HxlR family transcriptional regulator
MASATFDTLGYFEKLKAAGVPEQQAKVQTDALRELVDDKLVTREYLNNRLNELEYRLTASLTNRFGVMLAAAVAVLAVLIKIL